MTDPERGSAPPERRPRAAVVAALSALIAVLAWPRPSMWGPASSAGYFNWGLEFSWQLVLHLTAVHHLQWGRDALFTYGPLGFLCVPLPISPYTWLLGLLFVAAATCALAAALLLALGRWLPLPLAGVAALLGVLLAGSLAPEAASLAGLLFAGLALGGAFGPRATRLAPALVAAAAALLLLVKASAGIELAVALPCLLAAEPHRLLRRGVAAAAAFAGALALAWLAASQSLAGFPVWLRGAFQVASGYAEAMAIDDPVRRWDYAAFTGYVAVFWLVFAAGADRSCRRRLASLAALLVLAGVVFAKAGFVRRSGGDHPAMTFSFLLIAPLMVPWRPRWRPLGLALALAPALVLVFSREIPPRQLFDLAARVEGLAREVSTLVRPGALAQMEAAVRARVRGLVPLPAPLLAELRGHRVHVDPHDAAIAWAYGFDWAPVPVFQSYSAYTPELDRLNAQRLADPAGPDRILRRRLEEGIDERSPLWETPEYALARLCRYREVAASELWQVLARGPDRCGAEAPLATASAAPGASLSIPAPSAPDRIVVAHLDTRRSLAERLRTALFKPGRALYAVTDGRRLRLVPANLGGPLLMRIPATSGWSPPFDGSLWIHSLAVEGASAPVAARFAEIPLAPPAP
jgi:hypothetical protein